MKTFLFVAILSAIAGLFTGAWWVIAIAAFLGGLIFSDKGGVAFLAAFLGVALYWFLLAAYHDWAGQGIMTFRAATLLGLPHQYLLFIITALIGGLVGGLSGLSGFLLRRSFSR